MRYFFFKATGTFDTGAAWLIRFPSRCDRFDGHAGRRIRNWDPNIIARGKVASPYVDFLPAFPFLHAASPKLQKLIEEYAPGEVQFLPFIIHSFVPGEAVEGYAVANYLRKIQCLDRKRSKIDRSSGVFDRTNPWAPHNQYGDVVLKKVVLCRDKIGDACVFRFVGSSETPVMREDLKRAIEDAGTIGMSFKEVEAVDSGAPVRQPPQVLPVPRASFSCDSKVFKDFEKITAKFVKEGVDLGPGMQALLDYCDKQSPDDIWETLRKLDFEADYGRLTSWLKKLLKDEPPSRKINGLWFGLFNPSGDECQLYLAGSKRFNVAMTGDWHCQPEYFPKGRYANSRILPALYQAAGTLGEVVLCQGYVCLVTARWCRGPWRALLLGDAPLRGIAFGHDDGDVYLVEVLQQEQAS